MEFEDPELEPTIVPLDARLSLRGRVEEFRTLFDRLTAVTPQKEKIPGTSFVHVAAEDGVVRFTATDGAQTLILESATIRVLRDGKARLPGHKLKAIFGLAPEEAITLTIVADTANLVSGRAIWNVAIPSGDKMPAVPDVNGIDTYPVPRRPLFKALNAVRRGLPSLGSRKSLEQVNFAKGFATSSDGQRLLRRRVENLPEHLNFSIPKDTVAELLRSLTSNSEAVVHIGASDDLIVLKDVGETIVSRQLAMDFPDLEAQLITPALENKNSLLVDSIELRDLVKRIRISADPEYASVTLRTTRTKDGEWELTVLTRDRSGNSASEAMYAQWEGEDEPGEVVLNHKYLIDLLDAYNGRLVAIRVGVGTKTRAAPIIVRDDEKGFVGVVQQSTGR